MGGKYEWIFDFAMSAVPLPQSAPKREKELSPNSLVIAWGRGIPGEKCSKQLRMSLSLQLPGDTYSHASSYFNNCLQQSIKISSFKFLLSYMVSSHTCPREANVQVLHVPAELVSLQVIWLLTSGLWRVHGVLNLLSVQFFSHQGRHDIFLALYLFNSKMEGLKTLKFEFHIIFICHKILCFFWLFYSYKNVKTIVTSLAVLKQATGWIWFTGDCMPTFDLRDLMLVYGWSSLMGKSL